MPPNHPLNSSVIWFTGLSPACKTMRIGELKVNLIFKKLL